VASPVGGQFQIRNGSGNVLATVSVPNTGGWQNWQTVSSNLTLPAGTQTIRVYSASNGWNFNWMETSAPTTTTPPSPPSPAGLRIEAESYVSMSGVAKENTTDIGGGQNVGYIDMGDWMDYSVNIASAGSSAINLRVSSPSGGQLQLRNSSGSILATIAISATGGWQNWQTVTSNITLPAGPQTLRVYSSSNGWNFNWMELATGTMTNPTDPSPSSSRIEAENYKTMDGVVKEPATDVGGGQNLGYIDTGDWMDYSVNVSAAGSYSLKLRVASPTGGQVQIKASNGNVLSTATVPNTGGWQNWQTISSNLTLPAGTQTIRVYSAFNGWNFNWFEITGAGSVSAASIARADVNTSALMPSSLSLNVYPNPVRDNYQLQLNNNLTGAVLIQIYNMSGALQKQISLIKPNVGSIQYNLSMRQLAAGNYIMKVTINNLTDSKQISKQ
jgi:endoglucanase